ncbi:MAG: hypothetical protein ACXVX8_02360 [Blastococcus sp.]
MTLKRWHVGSRLPLAFAVVLMVVCGAAVLGFIYYFLSTEVLLDLRGESTQAVVERVVASKVDVVHIRFSPPSGAPVRTTVQSLFGATPHAGSRLNIQYDPARPTRAREAGNHDPLLLVPFFAAAFYFTLRRAFGPLDPREFKRTRRRLA